LLPAQRKKGFPRRGELRSGVPLRDLARDVDNGAPVRSGESRGIIVQQATTLRFALVT
jgi:hypothetical protein